MSLPKPQMRGLLAKRTRVLLPLGFAVSLSLVLAYKFIVADPRKRAYVAFYKQYDAVKDFNAMREAGVFESVQPTGK